MFTSNELRLLRHSRQMKQAEVAGKMNIKKQRYSQLENNDKRPVERTIQIVKILGYTPESARKYLDNIPLPIKYVHTSFNN